MSFREYLNFVTTEEHTPIEYKALLQVPNKFNYLGQIHKIKGLFAQYLSEGYYPFVFEDAFSYHERVERIIEKTIYEDIANFYNLKTPNLITFKKILAFLTSIPPGEVNTNNIAKNLGAAHQTIEYYLSILQSVGLIQLIYPAEGGNQNLRKAQKIFLHNTNLHHTLQKYTGAELNKGALRELYFLQAMRDAGNEVFYSKQGDYCSRKAVFEIGDKNKTIQQLKDASLQAFLVKDDILATSKNIIPLLFMGFLY